MNAATTKLSLAALCLTACGIAGTWDYPFPRPDHREPILEEKISAIVKHLEKNRQKNDLQTIGLQFNFNKFKVEISKGSSPYLEAAVTYVNKKDYNDDDPTRKVFWGDMPPYGSPDLALVENGSNIKEISPKTICLVDVQEMVIDALYEQLKGKDHQLWPNQPFYRYFRICFNELTKF